MKPEVPYKGVSNKLTLLYTLSSKKISCFVMDFKAFTDLVKLR